LAAARTNVLLILTDNQSPSLIGAYGNREIRTPNIDRLAAQGTLFTRAFATSGVCSPARATLLTGLIPSRTGVHNGLPENFAVPEYSAIEEFRNLPQTLADAGYVTGSRWQVPPGRQREAAARLRHLGDIQRRSHGKPS